MPALLPEVPPSMPRGGNAFTRFIGRSIMRLGGWRLVGELPDLKKVMIIFAPHSSGWDAVWGLAAKVALGVHVGFMVKKEACIGPLGWLLRRMGGIPIDRSSPGGVVRDIARRFHTEDAMWLGIAPEGTRKPVERWKSGFWRIASAADVPVLAVYIHYPERVIGVGEMFALGADAEADMRRMRESFRPYQGKNRGV